MASTNHNDDTRPSSNQQWEEYLTSQMGLEEGIETGDDRAILDNLVDRDTGLGRTLDKLKNTMLSGSSVTGGDIDDDLYQAEVVGEEAVGGQTPTPDQNVTEDLLQSMGISSIDGETVRTEEKLEWRDKKRWELDPESSEDYPEHC
ncbi:MAG: DUF6335 family protein [Prochloraceae cyanobacterium]|nr:DUF6335 family protein [Prochloraceae cyanobacterium]